MSYLYGKIHVFKRHSRQYATGEMAALRAGVWEGDGEGQGD